MPVTITIKEQHSPLPYHYVENKKRKSPYRPKLQRNSYLDMKGIDHMILFIT
jgi:hypothetical protein